MATVNKVSEYIKSCNPNVLKNATKRKTFARKIQKITGYWSVEEILSFVEEMRGLDFYRSEDRAIFCNFLNSWLLEGAYESFNA